MFMACFWEGDNQFPFFPKTIKVKILISDIHGTWDETECLIVTFPLSKQTNQNQLARMSPREEGSNCQVLLWLPRWVVCLKTGGLLERQQPAFLCQQPLPMNEISCVSLSPNEHEEHRWVNLILNLEVSRGPLVRWEALGVSQGALGSGRSQCLLQPFPPPQAEGQLLGGRWSW